MKSEIARCNAEIQEMREQAARECSPKAWLVSLGTNDWAVEKVLIHRAHAEENGLPIRPEFRKFYDGKNWYEARQRILARAGGEFDLLGNYTGGAKCELCRKPDRERIETRLSQIVGQPRMWWRAVSSTWWNHLGEPETPPRFYRVERFIVVVLAVVHLNHTPGDDRDENLKALCQWCHLNYDKLHHKETRAQRKDSQRPILQSDPPGEVIESDESYEASAALHRYQETM